MRDLALDRAEVWVVGSETERHAWALEMPGSVHDNTILKLTTATLEEVAGAGDVLIARVRPLHRRDASLSAARGHGPDRAGARGALVRLRSLNTPLVPQAASLIDIALWDGGQDRRAAALPAARRRARSRPGLRQHTALADAQAYVDYCAARLEESFTAAVPLLVRALARHSHGRDGASRHGGRLA